MNSPPNKRFDATRRRSRLEGTRTNAARELGIGRRTIITKIKEYGLA